VAIVIHLTDLRSILQNHPPVEVKGKPMINFTRCMALAALMQNVLQVTVPDVAHSYDANKLAYLQSQIHDSVIDNSAKVELESRACILQKEENRLKEARHRLRRETIGL
jgi:hypothetical protein